MRVAWAAVATRVRADARRAWPSWLVLGLLVGLAGGTVMGAAAGARRTESAYARLYEETNAPDAELEIACQAISLADACPSLADAVAAFRAQPGVLDAAGFLRSYVPITDAGGRAVQPGGDPCYGGAGVLTVMTPLDDRVGRDILGIRLLEGRLPDDSRADEAVISPIIAKEHGVEVGDRLLTYFDSEDCQDPDTWSDVAELTVVGIGFDALEVPPKSIGYYGQSLHTSAAFAETHVGYGFQLILRLDHDTTVSDLQQADGLPEFTVVTDVQREVTEPIEAGTGSDANALWVLTAVAAIASACVIGPATGRHRRSLVGDEPQLVAIGWARRERALRGAAHVLVIWGIACTVAVAMVVVSSTQTPVGDARAIEPTAGVAVDVAVLAIGVVALLLAITAGLVRLSGPRGVRQPRPRNARLVKLAVDAGMHPARVLGVRVGIEPDRRDVPVRSSLLAVGIGAAAVVGVLVFTASAQHLRDTPANRGVVWDDAVFVPEELDEAEVAEQAESWPEVHTAGTASFNARPLKLGPSGQVTVLFVTSARGDDVTMRVVSGRAPIAEDELLVNPRLAADLDLEVGERVEVAVSRDFLSPEELNALIGAPTVSFEIVGTGAVPLSGGFFTSSAAMTLDGYVSLFPADHSIAVAPSLDFLLINRRPGVDAEALVERLATAGVPYRPEGFDLEAFLEGIVSVDATSTESVPDLLGLLMVVTSAGVLLYGLAVAISGSRRELAIVRALGFDRRLLRRTARWVGGTHAITVVALALPVGVLAGRTAWRAYETTLGVAPADRVPVAELAALGIVATAVCLVAASVIGTWHVRRCPGAVLRDHD